MKIRSAFVSNSSSGSFVIAVKPESNLKTNNIIFPLGKRIRHRIRMANSRGFTKLIFRNYEDRNEAVALLDFLSEMHKAGEIYLVGYSQEDCFYDS